MKDLKIHTTVSNVLDFLYFLYHLLLHTDVFDVSAEKIIIEMVAMTSLPSMEYSVDQKSYQDLSHLEIACICDSKVIRAIRTKVSRLISQLEEVVCKCKILFLFHFHSPMKYFLVRLWWSFHKYTGWNNIITKLSVRLNIVSSSNIILNLIEIIVF